jgi:hypothetical protein
MRKDWKYVLYLSIVIGIYVLVKLSETKQNSWNVTLAHEDKEPYGTYAFNQLLPSLLKDVPLKNSYKTIYELKDSLKERSNLMIIATSFSAGKADTEVLLNHVRKGGTVFISAHYFNEYFADTLGLRTKDYLFKSINEFSKQDSASVHFTSASFDSAKEYFYRRDNIHNYFSKLDSVSATVIAKNDQRLPVTIRIAFGKGQLLLNCTPMAFTNIYLLNGSNDEFISNTLSYLNRGEVYRTEYYHLGRMEIETPLRFILITEPLKWAYYITAISLLLFMIFEAKRKQRIIPVIPPLSNTTLEFVSTIGNLYYQKADHKNIAEKKIQFFLDQVRTNYHLSTANRNELFIVSLAKKTGNPEEATRALIKKIDQILNSSQIDRQMLVDLNERLESFLSRKD